MGHPGFHLQMQVMPWHNFLGLAHLPEVNTVMGATHSTVCARRFRVTPRRGALAGDTPACSGDGENIQQRGWCFERGPWVGRNVLRWEGGRPGPGARTAPHWTGGEMGREEPLRAAGGSLCNALVFSVKQEGRLLRVRMEKSCWKSDAGRTGHLGASREGYPGPDKIGACQLSETSQGLGVFLWPYQRLGYRMKQGESWAALGAVLLCLGPQG